MIYDQFMLIKSIKKSLIIGWPIGVGVSVITLLGLYLRGITLSFLLSGSVIAAALTGIILLLAPIEFHKLSRNSRH